EHEGPDLDSIVVAQRLRALGHQARALHAGAVRRAVVDDDVAPAALLDRRVARAHRGVRQPNVGPRPAADQDAILLELVERLRVRTGAAAPALARADRKPHAHATRPTLRRGAHEVK